MNTRRWIGLFALAAVAFVLSGCTHNTASWMQTVPTAKAEGGLIKQPTQTRAGQQ